MTKFDLTHCAICPRKCYADRTKSKGACSCSDKISIAKVMIHHWEEPCISGDGKDKSCGSGAVFFGGCPLKCVFCQNKAISKGNTKMALYTPYELSEIIKKLEDDGAYNINFVSPTQFIPQIIESLDIYRPDIPIIFNTGGYENAETIKALSGYADIFLTDFKYGENSVGKALSAVSDYTDRATEALFEMVKITGEPVFSKTGMLKSGTIVRHLVLPGYRHDSLRVLSIIKETVGTEKILLSLMSQFTPDFVPENLPKLRRRITSFEYESILDSAVEMGFNGFSQDKLSAFKTYTPDF